MKIRRVIKASLGAIVGIVLVACSPTRHVPDGSYLLDHVKIETDDKSVKPSDLKSYLRQEPNHRMFGLFRFTLGLYNLSRLIAGRGDEYGKTWIAYRSKPKEDDHD